MSCLGARALALDSDVLPGLLLSLGSGPDPVEPPLLDALLHGAGVVPTNATRHRCPRPLAA